MSNGRLWQKIRSRLHLARPQPVILMYHRIASLTRDPWELAVAPEIFDEQVAYLRQKRTPLSMQEMVRALGEERLPQDAVALTFDDGYLDNLLEAKPVLERYGVPATVFIATGFTDTPGMFWSDELVPLVLDATAPAEITLEVSGRMLNLSWGDPEPGDAQLHWRGWESPKTSRQVSFQVLWRTLKSLDHTDRDRALVTLRTALGATHDPSSRAMTADEIRALQSGTLISVCAHTVFHPSLPQLSRSECREEIEQSLRRCRELATHPIAGFAYPYGDVNNMAVEEAERSGVAWACTTKIGFLEPRTQDLFRLPRVGVPSSVSRLKRALRG